MPSRRITRHKATAHLLPSLDLETCVTEIVRRQVHRPLGLVAAREEVKIRERFPVYMALPAPKVTTMQAPEAIASHAHASLLWPRLGRSAS